MLTIMCSGFEATLLVVVAVELGLALPPAKATAWLAGQSVVFFALTMQHMDWPAGGYWSLGAVGFATFAFTVATIAGREAAARRELARANAALERASRDAERLRIAGELHDLLGHDLVALHLNLEAARHVATGGAAEPVARAHEVAKKLLADVRAAVSSLRDDAPPRDLALELRAVAAGVQSPRVHLDAPDGLTLDDGARANAVVRCVQEIATNAMKHAHAENLWIALSREGDLLRLAARDDGRGASALAAGNGLRGMRERIERLGGEVSFETRAGGGFRVSVSLPVGERP
jgi:signal transduction histidine kinase